MDYAHKHGLNWVGFGRSDGDLTDLAVAEQAIKKAKNASHIFHVVTRQRTGSEQLYIQGDMLQINSRIHLNVLDAWRRLAPHAKLVSTGSSCAYPESNKPLAEELFGTGELHPSVTGYGMAKRILAEGSEITAKQHNLKYLHVILATLYGPFDHKVANRSHFAGGMLNRAVESKRNNSQLYEVNGHPNTTRDLLYVTDQIDAILEAEANFENQILNCSSNCPVTLGQVGESIVAALNWKVPVNYNAGTSTGPGFKTIDAAKFLLTTGWTPKVSLQQGFEEILKADYDIGR